MDVAIPGRHLRQHAVPVAQVTIDMDRLPRNQVDVHRLVMDDWRKAGGGKLQMNRIDVVWGQACPDTDNVTSRVSCGASVRAPASAMVRAEDVARTLPATATFRTLVSVTRNAARGVT